MPVRVIYKCSISRSSLQFYCNYESSSGLAAQRLRDLLALLGSSADAVRHQISQSDFYTRRKKFWKSGIVTMWCFMVVGDAALKKRVKNRSVTEHRTCYFLHYFLCFYCCCLRMCFFPFPCSSLLLLLSLLATSLWLFFLLYCLIFMSIHFVLCTYGTSNLRRLF